MKQYTFSIITPVHINNEERAKQFKRCLESINLQTYPKSLIEHIIINDGSTYPIEIPQYPWLTVYNQPNMQRITAYENGFKKAKNEIICMLDSDDRFVGVYLDKVNEMLNNYPKYKLFNFGSIHIHKDGYEHNRDPFEPKKKKIGHEVFGGGNIVNGTFVFKKEIYDELGAFPSSIIKDIDCTEINYPAGGNQYIRDLDIASPYDFSAWFQLQFPETREFFMVNVDSEPHKIIKEIGNPYGNDYALFYKYTRKYHSKPIKEYLYQVFHR
ncbi:MAG: glycosyltransferase family 2 protein [Rhabdochlamydiaceae bacterium]